MEGIPVIIGNAEKIIQWLFRQEKGKLFEIKEKSNKRSLSQNAYAWVLIGEIADKLRESKEDIYFRMLKEYGQAVIVTLRENIDPSGYLKYYEEAGEGVTNGKTFKHYRAFKGSSEFDTREMSIFVDGIVREAEQLGIPTLTDEEIKRLRL